MNSDDSWLQGLTDLSQSLGLETADYSHFHADTSTTSWDNDHLNSHVMPSTEHHLSGLEPNTFHSPMSSLHSDDSSTSSSDLGELSPSPHHHFDNNHAHGIVIGNPAEEMNHWHQQISSDTCGIAVQQSGIEHLTHHAVNQQQLLKEAQMHGWHSPNIGTSAEDFGKLISEHTQIPVEGHYRGNIAEIADKLNHGEEVFVGVNSTIEWLPDNHSTLGQAATELFDNHHFQGEGNHIVQVIGLEIDPNNPQNSTVIVNDPLNEAGRGMEIPLG